MTFQFERLAIPEVILIKTPRTGDSRGFFKELYKTFEFSANGIEAVFVQDNTSHSRKRVLRGLHYQKHPRAQGKYIFVSDGEIFDVAVDLRRGAPTFGKWLGVKLSADNDLALYIPPGFAHGYCVLSERATITYKVTAEYAPDLERGVIWNDPEIGIDWLITTPILSLKDSRLLTLRQADNNFEYAKE